jgi:hypothetical protein
MNGKNKSVKNFEAKRLARTTLKASPNQKSFESKISDRTFLPNIFLLKNLIIF